MIKAMIAALVIGCAVTTASAASAIPAATLPPAKIPIVYSVGDQIDEIAPSPDGHGVKLGYKYWQFSLFWLNIWTSEGEFVAYEEVGDTKNYESLGKTPQEAAATSGMSADKFKKPFSYSYPPGLLIFGGIIGFVVLKKVAGAARG